MGWGRTLGARLAIVGSVLCLVGLAFPALAAPVPNVGYARPGASSGGGGGTPTAIEVNLTDTPSFGPSALSATAGSSVVFDLHNVGGLDHSFALSGAANVTLNRSWTPAALDQFFAKNGTAVNQTVAAGAWANVTFGIPSGWAGASFEFASLVPYQFQAGMFGFLNVTSGAPAASFTVEDASAASTLSFTPAALGVDATSFPIHLEVEVSNLGTNPHTWTLAPQPNVNLTPGNFTTYFQAHPPAANIAIPTGIGILAFANVTLNSPGVYEFLCEIPGHFAAGMFGFLYVGVPVPHAPAAPSSAVVQAWILLTGAALLGVGVLLAVVAGLVGRFPPKGPPVHH